MNCLYERKITVERFLGPVEVQAYIWDVLPNSQSTTKLEQIIRKRSARAVCLGQGPLWSREVVDRTIEKRMHSHGCVPVSTE